MDKSPRAWALAGSKVSVVLGRSQHQLSVASILPARRRASGGGAVLAGPWLLRAAVRLSRNHMLLRHGPAPLASWLGRVHLQWLQERGLNGAQLYRGPSREHWACFGGWSVGEVFISGRKMTGIAQTWRRSAVLVTAGTLLYPPPWFLLCDALERPASQAAELAAATITVEECMGQRIDAAAWAHSLRAALNVALVRS